MYVNTRYMNARFPMLHFLQRATAGYNSPRTVMWPKKQWLFRNNSWNEHCINGLK